MTRKQRGASWEQEGNEQEGRGQERVIEVKLHTCINITIPSIIVIIYANKNIKL